MKRAALVLVAAMTLSAPLAADTPLDQKRPAEPDGTVSIENFSGSVKVEGWANAEVAVKGELGEGAELEFDGSGKRTRIEVAVEGNPMQVSSRLEVMVPAGSSVEIEGFQATITVAGVNGLVRAETVNGSITHSGASREVRLQSVNGAVETTKPKGRVRVEAVNGAVTVRDASGELAASTVHGPLTVSGGSFDHAQLETVAGRVDFEGTVAAGGTLGVESVSGAVDLYFPAGFAGDFNVSSFSGAIQNELGPAAEKSSEWTPASELQFTSGRGGARVNVETLSGPISIRKKR